MGRIALNWRSFLTEELLQRYFRKASFFRMLQLRRGGEDSEDFVDEGDGVQRTVRHAETDERSDCNQVTPPSSHSPENDDGGAEKRPLSVRRSVAVLIDNPDQRLADDVDTLTRLTMDLGMATLRKAMNIVSFSRILFGISPRLLAFCFVYCGVGTWAAQTLFGRVLHALHAASSRAEADLRFHVSTVCRFPSLEELYIDQPPRHGVATSVDLVLDKRFAMRTSLLHSPAHATVNVCIALPLSRSTP